MAHSQGTGRQESARKRKSQRRLLKLGAAAVVVAIGVTTVMIFFTGSGNSPSSTAQQPATVAATSWQADAFTGGPRLAVDRTVHDEGPVAYGQAILATFQLRNVGDQPLTLGKMSVNTLEGCWPTEPVVGQTTLQPGEETTLHYEFSMHEGMGGPHEFEIVVTSNDAVEPSVSLLVAGEYPKP